FNGIKLLDGSAGTTFNIQLGGTSTEKVEIDMEKAKIDDLTDNLGGLTTQADAVTELAALDTAIGTVNAARSALGAFQNRLEHMYNNVGTTAENLQAAESRIRDTDMAKEMMSYTKFNILQQASTAMLAQANQAPQGVLQLLR